jgi:hypothetical protein
VTSDRPAPRLYDPSTIKDRAVIPGRLRARLRGEVLGSYRATRVGVAANGATAVEVDLPNGTQWIDERDVSLPLFLLRGQSKGPERLEERSP